MLKFKKTVSKTLSFKFEIHVEVYIYKPSLEWLYFILL